MAGDKALLYNQRVLDQGAMNKDGEKTTVGVELPYSYLYNVKLYLRA